MQNISSNCIAHIPIVAPNDDGKADYFSQKQCYTESTQGLVGANLVFLDVTTGFLGSCHDAHNLRNTSMYTQAENGELNFTSYTTKTWRWSLSVASMVDKALQRWTSINLF